MWRTATQSAHRAGIQSPHLAMRKVGAVSMVKAMILGQFGEVTGIDYLASYFGLTTAEALALCPGFPTVVNDADGNRVFWRGREVQFWPGIGESWNRLQYEIPRYVGGSYSVTRDSGAEDLGTITGTSLEILTNTASEFKVRCKKDGLATTHRYTLPSTPRLLWDGIVESLPDVDYSAYEAVYTTKDGTGSVIPIGDAGSWFHGPLEVWTAFGAADGLFVVDTPRAGLGSYVATNLNPARWFVGVAKQFRKKTAWYLEKTEWPVKLKDGSPSAIVFGDNPDALSIHVEPIGNRFSLITINPSSPSSSAISHEVKDGQQAVPMDEWTNPMDTPTRPMDEQ
jgi:hypothetical protein